MELQISELSSVSDSASVILPPHHQTSFVLPDANKGFWLCSQDKKRYFGCPVKLNTTPIASVYDESAEVVVASFQESQKTEVIAIALDRKNSFGEVIELAHKSHKILDLQFSSGTLARLALIKGLSRPGWSGVVLGISSCGVVALMRVAVGQLGLASVALFRQVADLDVTQVVAVDCSTPTYCAIAALRGKRLGVFILKVSEVPAKGSRDAAFDRDLSNSNRAEQDEVLRCESFDVVWAPQPPKGGAKVLGFSIQPEAASVLYECGELHVFHPINSFCPSSHSETLEAWRTIPVSRVTADANGYSPTPGSNVALSESKQIGTSLQKCKLKSALSLRPTSFSGTSTDEMKERSDLPRRASFRGGIATFGERLLAVAFGRVLSVWDIVLGTGLGFVELSQNIVSISSLSSKSCVVLQGEENALFLASSPTAKAYGRTNVGLALKYQGSCDDIIHAENSVSTNIRPPLLCQPVAMSVLRATSDAGGRTPHIFQSHLRSEEKEEERRLRAVLSPAATPSPESVSRAISLYVQGNRANRIHQVSAAETGRECRKTWLRGQQGLFRLPSERFAAHAVARCMHEIHAGNMQFLIPFIDIIQTNVVSLEAVSSVLLNSRMTTSWGREMSTASPLSVMCALTNSITTTNGLEAVLLRVSDVSEADILRSVQFAVRQRELYLSKIKSTWSQETDNVQFVDGIDERDALLRTERLLLRCIFLPVGNMELKSAIRTIPSHDVLALLRYFYSLMEDRDLDKVSRFEAAVCENRSFAKPSEGGFEPGSYRGRDCWLDESFQSVAGQTESVDSTLSRCVFWVDKIVDAHMTSLIVDESGQAILQHLLELTRRRRKEIECATSLTGIVQHIQNECLLPGGLDPLFAQSDVLVPSFAALL